jgi:hypothetical protein
MNAEDSAYEQGFLLGFKYGFAAGQKRPPIKHAAQPNKPTEIDKALINYIEELVASAYNLTWEEIRVKSRKAEVNRARQVAAFLFYQFTRLSISKIGDKIGRDYTTVLHGKDAVIDLMHTNAQFSLFIGSMMEKIKKDWPEHKDIIIPMRRQIRPEPSKERKVGEYSNNGHLKLIKKYGDDDTSEAL